MAIPKDKLVIKKYRTRTPPERMTFKYEHEYDSPTGRKVFDNDIMGGIQSMSDTKINHCIPNGTGGMSVCAACKLRDSSKKVDSQKLCDFYDKARFHERCCYETFGEYCWSTKAQDAQKG